MLQAVVSHEPLQVKNRMSMHITTTLLMINSRLLFLLSVGICLSGAGIEFAC